MVDNLKVTLRLRSLVTMVLMLALSPAAHAYTGRATVTKQSEAEQGLKFDVTFQEQDGLLQVTVVAPRQVLTLMLNEFAVVQIEQGKTTLRVPLAAVTWEMSPKAKGEITITQLPLVPKCTFAVSQQNLLRTKLEVRYGVDDAEWTYVVDLASYQSQEKLDAATGQTNEPSSIPGGAPAQVDVNTQQTLVDIVGNVFPDDTWEYPHKFLPVKFSGLLQVGGPIDGYRGKQSWRKPVMLKDKAMGVELSVNVYGSTRAEKV